MRRYELDEFADLDSLIHRWEPRCKLVGLLSLIFAFAWVENLRLVPLMLGVTAALYLLSRLPLTFLTTRLQYPGLFILAVVGLLPFLSGSTVIWQWGMLSLRQEGVEAMLLIAGRFLAIVVLSLILFGTTPFLKTVRALQSLGLPVILADMLLLSYRYLFEIAAMVTTMQQAMRLRGFQQAGRFPFLPSGKTLRQLAALVGTLLIRSYEQSERLYKAMRLRGYGYHPVGPQSVLLQHAPTLRWHLLGLLLSGLTAVGFVLAELQYVS